MILFVEREHFHLSEAMTVHRVEIMFEEAELTHFHSQEFLITLGDSSRLVRRLGKTHFEV